MDDKEINIDDTIDMINEVFGEDDNTEDYNESDLSPSEESFIVLQALANSYDSPQEFRGALESIGPDLINYGVVTDDKIYKDLMENLDQFDSINDVATEATKNIKIDNWKDVVFRKLKHQRCIALGRLEKHPAYEKYALHKAKAIEYRNILYQKFDSRASKDVKRSLQNGKNKASAMPNDKGRDISKKLDRLSTAADKNARNYTAIKK